MRRILTILLFSLMLTLSLCSAFLMASCSADKDETSSQVPLTYTGQIESIDMYGALIPNFTPVQLKAAGFGYTDMLHVKVGDVLSRDMPFTTGFNEVGVLDFCLCDYNSVGKELSVSLLSGNVAERIGGKVGDSITVTLKEKEGYREMYEIMHSEYDTIFSKYGTAERFANFREVTTTGMARGVLYRSSNPLNPRDNAARCTYVDRLAESVGIKTEIDLADNDARIMMYHDRPDFDSPYCYNLFVNDQVVALGLSADAFVGTFKKALGKGLRFMIQHEAPYLVHCNEGKDRCGFVSMLLEALAGASYEELAADYMVTFDNFYQVKPGTHEYDVRRHLAIDRLIWLLDNESALADCLSIDWDSINPKGFDLQQAARHYILECGLTAEECDQLQNRLQGK